MDNISDSKDKPTGRVSPICREILNLFPNSIMRKPTKRKRDEQELYTNKAWHNFMFINNADPVKEKDLAKIWKKLTSEQKLEYENLDKKELDKIKSMRAKYNEILVKINTNEEKEEVVHENEPEEQEETKNEISCVAVWFFLFKNLKRIFSNEFQLILEKEYISKNAIYDFTHDKVNYRVNMLRSTFKDLTNNRIYAIGRMIFRGIQTDLVRTYMINYVYWSPEDKPFDMSIFKEILIPSQWVSPELLLSDVGVQYHTFGKDTEEYKRIVERFNDSCKQYCSIESIVRVHCKTLWNKFITGCVKENCKKQLMHETVTAIRKTAGTKNNVRFLFVSSNDEQVKNLLSGEFNHTNRFTYNASDSILFDKDEMIDKNKVHKMILVRIIVGQYYQKDAIHKFGLDESNVSEEQINACSTMVNDTYKPGSFSLIEGNDGVYPEYVISYKFN